MIGTHAYPEVSQLNDFRIGYPETFIAYHAQEFGWDIEFTERVLRDAIRFLTLSALPTAGIEDITESRVMVSSPTVDKIVDAIFLDSPLLKWLEEHLFFIRLLHIPFYAHGETNPVIRDLRYDFTLALMHAAGYELDPDIWPPQLPAGYRECIGGCPPPCHIRAYRD